MAWRGQSPDAQREERPRLTALILTNSKRPILGACAFTAGPLVLNAIVAAVVLTIFWGDAQATGNSSVSAWIDIVLGVVLLAVGVQAVFETHTRETDAATPRPDPEGSRWHGAGALGHRSGDADHRHGLARHLRYRSERDRDRRRACLAGRCCGRLHAGHHACAYYAPAVYFAIRRQRASEGLGRISDWLINHLRPLEIIAGLVIGLPFLLDGLATL